MEKFDTLIIGGGPAGLMAAIRSSSLGRKTAIAEKNHSLGEKLLISGRGRCNFTNAEDDINTFIEKYGDNGKFLYSAFSRKSAGREFSPKKAEAKECLTCFWQSARSTALSSCAAPP